MIQNRPDITNLLSQMKAMQTQAGFSDIHSNGMGSNKLGSSNVNGIGNSFESKTLEGLSFDTNSTPKSEFSNLLSSAINKVNDTQMNAGALARAYETGDGNVDLTEVMVSLQKASISFQAATQVRNKLVEAYKEVMNMPV